MPKRVLIFSLAYHPVVGGAEIAIKEITSRIPDYEWDMVTMRFDKSHRKHERLGNVNVYRIGGGLGYLSKMLFIPQAALFAFGRKYDLHWGMMTYMIFPISLLWLWGSRTPYIITLQDGDPFTFVFNRLRIIVFRPLLSYGFKHASKVQTISAFLAEWARHMGYKGEVQVIPNGVDVNKFQITRNPPEQQFSRAGKLQKAKSRITLITTSRLVKKNAVGDIIESLKSLPKDTRLDILGSGPLEQKLRAHTSYLGLESRVNFLGNIPNNKIPSYLHNADVFVRPSLSEGQGISFIEAMAAGVPVVATRVGGITDFLKDGETGVFCEVGNPKSIAREVRRLMTNAIFRQRIIENAKRLVIERYDWDLIAEQMKSKVFNI